MASVINGTNIVLYEYDSNAIYYFNGGTAQGTFDSIVCKELSRSQVAGTSVDFNNVVTPFEAYVANVNTASCSVNETSVASNNVAIIQGPSAPSTTAVILGSSLTSTFDLSDAVEGSVIYLKNSITITDSSVPPKTASGNLKFKVINDSASTITVTYITSVSVLANKTAFLEFSSTAVTEYSTAISNLAVQDEFAFYVVASSPLVHCAS